MNLALQAFRMRVSETEHKKRSQGRKIKTNYNDVMEKIIASLEGKKASLLLHACCGPCSTACLEKISSFFEISVYFYNPNIYPFEEYEKRRDEIFKFVEKLRSATGREIRILEGGYDKDDYDRAIRIEECPELAFEAERGERCRRCYEFRMKKAFEYAAENDFDFFATTLTLSPYKDSDKVNEIGRLLDEQAVKNGLELRYLYSDFKKKNGYLRSIEISKEYGVYRQDYCGCVYSLSSNAAGIVAERPQRL